MLNSLMIGRADKLLYERVDKKENGCWEFKGNKINGYGTTVLEGKQLYVHNLFFQAYKRPLLVGERLKNNCGNKGCVNPEHWDGSVGLKKDYGREFISLIADTKSMARKVNAKIFEDTMEAYLLQIAFKAGKIAMLEEIFGDNLPKDGRTEEEKIRY